MPFKVVQTLEKGKPVLTVVPQYWEKDGTLYWPKNQADKLIKIEDICPEDHWIPIPCELKRDGLFNYEEAQVEINNMLNQWMHGQVQNNRNQSAAEPSTSSQNNSVVLKIESCPQDPLVHDEQAPAALSAGMELILENQRIMLDNQRKIMKKLSEFSAKLDKLTSVNQILSCDTSTSEHDSVFTPIDNIEALDEFENELKDPEKRHAYYKRYSIICQGHGEGVTCAYFLTDLLFTRKFLTKASWAGGSRSEETKVPFKMYHNIIKFFHNLVYDCDKRFSLLECHNFFKTILRNAVKRSESKLMRASSKRSRIKHSAQLQISFMNKNDDGDDYEESRDDMESSLYNSSSKKRRTSDVETSEEETDAEKELNESDGTLRQIKK